MEFHSWRNQPRMEGCPRGSVYFHPIAHCLPVFQELIFQSFSSGAPNHVLSVYTRSCFESSVFCHGLLTHAVCACGGRKAHPIATTSPADSQFDCSGINRELAANERSVVAIGKEKAGANAKNIALGVKGAAIFFPTLFFMDP
jgi:hypothetical protein